MNLRRTLPAAAAAGLVAGTLLATPADAADVEHFALDYYEPFVIASCAGGHDIENHLTDGRGTLVVRQGTDGTQIVELNLRYTMRYTDLATGETHTAQGTRHLTIDDSGYVTDSGNHRSLSVPGEGHVLKQAGHKVFDATSDQVVWNAGPLEGDEDAARVCAIFGLELAG